MACLLHFTVIVSSLNFSQVICNIKSFENVLYTIDLDKKKQLTVYARHGINCQCNKRIN